MKYKLITLIIAFKLAACGSSDEANDVVDNIQNDGKYSKEDGYEEYEEYEEQDLDIPNVEKKKPRAPWPSSATSKGDTPAPPTTGVLAFLPDTLVFECDDGSRGQSESTPLQMEYEIKDGLITVKQTALQTVSTVQNMNPTTEIISMSAWTGPIDSDGVFDITGRGVAEDYKAGTMRVTYRIQGYFTPTGWEGVYKMTIGFDDMYTICNYVAPFDGERFK